jgi:hypothetical protein
MASKILKFILNLEPLQRFKSQVTMDLNGGGQGSIGKAMREEWPRRYFDFLRRRFRQNSAGGGDWQALSPVTLSKDLGRTPSGKRKRRRGILRVTDTLYNALTPGNAGNIIVHLKNGVRCGIGGSARHPTRGITFRALTKIHQEGTATIPARPIVVEPDQATINTMQNDMKRGFKAFTDTLPRPKGK